MINYKGRSIKGGFTMSGANTDPSNPPPAPKQDTGPQLSRDSQYPTMVQNGTTGGSGGTTGNGGVSSSPENPPSARRPFNYERHGNFLWGAPSDYEVSGNNARKTPWGTIYTDHVIDRIQPSNARYPTSGPSHEGRSIPPKYIELTLAYGQIHTDTKDRKTYKFGDLEVGAKDKESFVYHAKYTRKLFK